MFGGTWFESVLNKFAFFSLLHDALILGDNNLSGSIPSELGLLTDLEVISLCKYGFRLVELFEFVLIQVCFLSSSS